MSPSIHELKRMVRKAEVKTSKCDRCDKRRVLVDGMLCRACKEGPKQKKVKLRPIITPSMKRAINTVLMLSDCVQPKRMAVFKDRTGTMHLRGDATPDEIERTFG